jgi:hypothetical protein
LRRKQVSPVNIRHNDAAYVALLMKMRENDP